MLYWWQILQWAELDPALLVYKSSRYPQEAIGDPTIVTELCALWKHCPVSIDKHTYICSRPCTKPIHHIQIQAHHKTESKSEACDLLPAGKSKQFSIDVTVQTVAEAPKSPSTSDSPSNAPLEGKSVDKASSGHLLTGTRSLWVLNGKDLLNKASIQAFTSFSPEVRPLKSLVALKITRGTNELLTF